MNARPTARPGAVHLTGITFTLRRIYQPSFVTPDLIAGALARLEWRDSVPVDGLRSRPQFAGASIAAPCA